MNNNLCWILILLSCCGCGTGSGGTRNVGCACNDAFAQPAADCVCGCGCNNAGIINNGGNNCACDVLWLVVLASLFGGCNNGVPARNTCC